jgi:hypothetical protein
MLQKPNTVFVGKKVNAAGSTLVVGDVVLVNAATGAPVAIADAADYENIQLGYVKAVGSADVNATIVKTGIITKKGLTSKVYTANVAKTEASSVLDFTAASITVGHRYVIRIVYTDLYEHPGQFTHTYEHIATSTNVDTLATAFETIINAHKGARVTASYSASPDQLTLTAKVVDGPEAGIATKEAITPYSQVQMKVFVYSSNPAGGLGSSAYTATGVTVATTASKPGKGNAFVVRDREQAALGYKGITFRTTWPIIKPELTVDLSKSYDELVIEYAKSYQSPDNQYVKSTDLAAEIYVQNDASSGSKATDLNAALEVWLDSGIDARITALEEA